MAPLSEERLSRRTVLSAGAALVAGGGAALVLGCGGGSSSRTQTATATRARISGPLRGGEITIGRLLKVFGLDPHIDVTGLDIDQLVYSYLYRWDAVNQEAVFNDFASSLEMPDPDGREFIFSLRPGVKVHSHPDNPASGEDLTSNDCKESFIRRAAAITAPDKRLGLAISGARSGAFLPDASVLRVALQTPDPYTFSLKMARRFTPALREMAKPDWAIVPAKVIEKFGNFQGTSLSNSAFGSGPFAMQGFDGDKRVALARHPQYFLSPRPWLDRMTYEIESDRKKLVEALESGRLDDIQTTISRDQYLDWKDDPHFTVSKTPTLFYPCINFKIKPPFEDIRVREAVDLALDREKFIREVWGGEAKYNGPIAWPLEQWALPQDELRSLLPHDVTRARLLLEAAGFDDGFNATLKFPRLHPEAPIAVSKIAEIISNDLAEVGIRLKLEDAEQGTFIANILLPGNFEMAFFLNLPYDDPDRPLSFYHTPRGSFLSGGNYSNSELDKLIEAQAAEPDENKRREIVLRAQRLAIQGHGPQITLPSGYAHYARRSYVHYPYEIGEAPSLDAGPWGADIWTEEA